MKTAIELIAEERQEQIEKHGWTLAHDVIEHSNGDLVDAAIIIAFDVPTDVEFMPDPEWAWKIRESKMALADEFTAKIERVKIAAALLAGELDRILFLEMVCNLEPGFAYSCKHIPSGEEWYIIGINVYENRVCAGGWPPSIGKLTDCIDFKKLSPLTEEELRHRENRFGTNWI